MLLGSRPSCCSSSLEVYTDQIWNVEVSEDKMPFQTYLLEQIRTFLGEVKSMNLLADEQGLTLTSQEREKLKQLADDYYNSLTDADKAYTKATRDDVYMITLSPWDRETVFNSLRKTHRICIAHEAVKQGGVGAEIAAVIAEEMVTELDAPVLRFGAPFCPIPFAKSLEDMVRITPEKVAEGIKGMF